MLDSQIKLIPSKRAQLRTNKGLRKTDGATTIVFIQLTGKGATSEAQTTRSIIQDTEKPKPQSENGAFQKLIHIIREANIRPWESKKDQEELLRSKPYVTAAVADDINLSVQRHQQVSSISATGV
ncbi:hypothetical protein RHGRI_018874 [Rhododendron griersonianum]|uniref:Uncharacterized protein n=1 Tax=Rhododendron griersonianum TaxID=479676 RepID=A0AAV6K382_9ERIC|nr:hypothetical protein RHGRI_018874 [Rhododendron griersonianum]